MEQKKVSVIVPVFNQEKYLDRSIPSLLAQTYKNIEIILVNDGSTDSSGEILERYRLRDDRIFVVNKENGGLVDATITGISHADGDYIAFLDPDDYVGEEFIANFMDSADGEYDFIAAGFYYDNCGTLRPYELKKNGVLNEKDILKLRGSFLLGEKNSYIPNDIFVARWNKIYSAACVKKAAALFSEFKNCSLGEDTIFTFLMLLNASSGKTIKAPNCYYYNVGNQNSMMKSGQIEAHTQKADNAFRAFGELLEKNGHSQNQAYALYYHLTTSLFSRLKAQDKDKFAQFCRHLRTDKIYGTALRLLLKKSAGLREKYGYICKLYFAYPPLYSFLTDGVMNCLRGLKNTAENVIFCAKSLPKCGIYKTFKLMHFRRDRKNAFVDIQKKLPLIEKRIEPIIQDFSGIETDLAKCPIEKNLFIFWWDGIEKAPEIVRECISAAEKHFADYSVILISKNNYKEYTDINPVIISNFERGNISVQTFSDILRFNLLKNNGGMWSDATIYFLEKYDLCAKLAEKSFESVEFSSSKSFLTYKGDSCSWSGYFIASRKNGVLVTAMDKIFEEYFLRYKTYSTYFFIDAVFMICKINHLDGDVLNKVHSNSGDMFLMGKILRSEYSDFYLSPLKKIPQKLQWKFQIEKDGNSVGRTLIAKEGEF